jgi:transketolase N-terminal domain/subunit
MRIRKELLKEILSGRLDRKFALYIKSSEFTPVFMRIGDTELFTGSTHDGTIKASSEELDALEQIIEINRIDISIEQ